MSCGRVVVQKHKSCTKHAAPCVLYSAPHLDHLFLAGKKFANDKLKETVQKWLMSQVGDFCEQGIQNLVPCYDTCLNADGHYVDK
jgi:hypothetical protein